MNRFLISRRIISFSCQLQNRQNLWIISSSMPTHDTSLKRMRVTFDLIFILFIFRWNPLSTDYEYTMFRNINVTQLLVANRERRINNTSRSGIRIFCRIWQTSPCVGARACMTGFLIQYAPNSNVIYLIYNTLM